MTVDSASEPTAQEGFLLPSESLPAVPNTVYLVTAQRSSWRHSHCQPTHTSRTGHARLHPFLPLLIYLCFLYPGDQIPRALISPFLLHTHTRSSWLRPPRSSVLRQVCRAEAGVGLMCCCLGSQGLSRSSSGFILHLVWFLVGHHNKWELQLCQKSTWRVHVCKMD